MGPANDSMQSSFPGISFLLGLSFHICKMGTPEVALNKPKS